MSNNIQAIRGMNDLLPSHTPLWQWLESQVRHILENYGYQEIRTPLLEKTELFARSIGEVTDIVEKEMYTFNDRNGDSLTLRPEGTASCVRACIENGLLHHQTPKLWYKGPMFRHERPQKGRYRQFHQIGAEVFGIATPDIDAEVILMTARMWKTLGLYPVELQINSLGSNAARAAYRDILVQYLSDHHEHLDEDSQRRLKTNPLRVLDSKNPDLQTIINQAPQLLNYLDSESAEHFAQLQAILQQAGVGFVVNPRLVRGLDYYNRTVFEWVTTALGAQGTVCAGGRYDGLVEQIGGKATPAFGFAMGIERLIELLIQAKVEVKETAPLLYLMMMGQEAMQTGFALAEQLRDAFPTLKIATHCGGGQFKAQFKKADKSSAQLALIIGEEEVKQQKIAVKYLREEKPQITVSMTELMALLQQFV